MAMKLWLKLKRELPKKSKGPVASPGHVNGKTLGGQPLYYKSGDLVLVLDHKNAHVRSLLRMLQLGPMQDQGGVLSQRRLSWSRVGGQWFLFP
jgi:hypothetical protein